jgi:hypothetical protein
MELEPPVDTSFGGDRMPASIGERLYKARTEYPLLTERGTGDFIYYYGPNDDYSQAAQRFLDPVYPRHLKERVDSLMQVIDDLDGHVTRGGIERIREVVLVGHANRDELLLPVVPNPSPEYLSVNAASLHALQAAFRAGGDADLSGFDDRRKQVVARMSRDSFVTIRACRFGRSKEGMFALYSFFGGHANVYAATTYMFFSDTTIGPNGRFGTAEDVVEHMASQRIIRRQPRTPNRRAAVVTMLAEPGLASEPINVAKADLSQESVETAQYLADVADLAKGKVPDRLSSAIEDELGVTLAQPTVSLPTGETIQSLNGAGDLHITQWLIHEPSPARLDVLEPQLGYKPSHELRLEFTVNDYRPTRGGVAASLEVDARVVELKPDANTGAARGRPRFYFQLFLNEVDADRYAGVLGTLAFHQVAGADPERVAELDGLEAALNRLLGGQNDADATLLREAVWKSAVIDIPEQGVSVTTVDITKELREQGVTTAWLVNAGEVFGVEKVEQVDDAGQRNVAIRLRKFMSPGEQDRYRRQLINDPSWGTNPDVPGVELMSYLDGLTVDELIALIDYLDGIHDVRRTEVGPVWRHSTAALHDKKDKTWEQPILATQMGDPLFPMSCRYYQEYHFDSKPGVFLDLDRTSYPFYSRIHWAQVRESNPPSPSPVADLFSEQVLPQPPARLSGRTPAPSDSMAITRKPATQTEIDMLATFSATTKFEYHPPAIPEDRDCEKFAQTAKKLFDLAALPESGLDTAIEAFAVDIDNNDPTASDIKKLMKTGRKLFNIMMDKTGSKEEKIAVKLMERFPRLAMGAQVTPRLVQLARGISFATTMYSLFAWMFTRLLADVEGFQATGRALGAQAAMRAYARNLRAHSRAHPNDFPETIPFSIAAPSGSDPQTFAMDMLRVSLNAGQDENLSVIPHPRLIREGYDKGRRVVEESVARELRYAATTMNRQLRIAGLTECEVNALHKSGWLDPPRVRDAVMMQTANAIDKVADEVFKQRDED